jgi:hypothetical protein
MCLVADGSPVQTLAALIVSFFYMMFVLKTAPFLHDNDDLLSFVTSLQLVLTFLGALILQMDQAITMARTASNQVDEETGEIVNGKSMEFFDPMFVGIFLIVINVLCLILMVLSLTTALAPMCKQYCCRKKNQGDTKVNPEDDSNDDGGGDF